MNYRLQKKYISALKRYENKMENRERADFKLFIKREKDEEEFDTLSFKRLSELYEKYHVNRQKPNLDSLFKKSDSNT